MDSELVNILDIAIDPNLPAGQKRGEYIRLIKNPYLFRCEDIVVSVKYSEDGASLDDCVKGYFQSVLHGG